MRQAIVAIYTIFASSLWAATCPDISGTHTGTISNSNYGHVIQISQTGCSSISVKEWESYNGPDNPSSVYRVQIGGGTVKATADLNAKLVTTLAGFFNSNGIYVTSTDVHWEAPEWPGASLMIFSKTPAGKLSVTRLDGSAQDTYAYYFWED